MGFRSRMAAAVVLTTTVALMLTPQAASAAPQEELIGVLRMPSGGADAFRALPAHPQARALQPTRSLQEVAQLQMKATLEAADDPTSSGSVRASTTLAADYDYFTFDECRQENDPDQDEQEMATKNHFAWCVVARGRYDFYRRVAGIQIWVGAYTFRITILGKGQRGLQRMDFEMELDDWDEQGLEVRPNAELDVDFNCQNYPNAECSTTNFGGRDDTIGGWQRNGYYHATFDTSASPGGGDGVHYDFDKVNYHDFQLLMDSAQGAWVFHHPFRCDAAQYASGGACIFHQTDAVMHYRLTPPTPEETVTEVARHIKDAQDDPENVKPGGVGTEIPGSKESGAPLTRLVAAIDPAAETFAGRSSDIVERDCARYFTAAEREGKDCDEYPFNSTWQGPAFTEQVPGSKWKFSVRPVDRTQNRRAGNYLLNWYTNDHILAHDPFYVTILP